MTLILRASRLYQGLSSRSCRTLGCSSNLRASNNISAGFKTRSATIQGTLHVRPLSTPTAPIKRPLNAYPERLLVYHVGTPTVVFHGLGKLSTVLLFAAGCFVFAPAVYANPAYPFWMTPGAILLFAVPMCFTALATAPFVASIHVQIPGYARRSTEALHAFARRMPGNTRLEFTKVGFLPLPRHRGCQFSELHTLPPNKLRYANMEQVPRVHQGRHVPRLVRATLGQLYVRPGDLWTKKSRAPGVWQMMLDQIGMRSSGPVKKERGPRENPSRVVPRPVKGKS